MDDLGVRDLFYIGALLVSATATVLSIRGQIGIIMAEVRNIAERISKSEQKIEAAHRRLDAHEKVCLEREITRAEKR